MTTPPTCPECGPTCPLHGDPIAYLDPVRAAAAERALEQAEARIDQLTNDRDTYRAAWQQTENELALTIDTLRHRTDSHAALVATRLKCPTCSTLPLEETPSA